MFFQLFCFKISPSFVPINHKSSKTNYSTYEITAESFLNNHEMSTLSPTEGSYIACCMLYRGDMNVEEVFSACNEVKKTFQIPFVDWVIFFDF
jgi:tubulin alpha